MPKEECGARAGAVAGKAPVAYLLAMTAAQNRESSTPSLASAHDKILIVDFGSQVTQLIARRVREDGVYCEIVPFNKADAAFKEMKPKAVILSGGPASVLDDNARMRLRYAWLVASDYARDRGPSFSGLTPRIAERVLRSSGVDVTLEGEGRLVLTRFDTSRRATAGVVSIRVAQGRNLLLVTRSRSGTAFCYVQRGPETGIGSGDVHRVAQCAIRWG